MRARRPAPLLGLVEVAPVNVEGIPRRKPEHIKSSLMLACASSNKASPLSTLVAVCVAAFAAFAFDTSIVIVQRIDEAIASHPQPVQIGDVQRIIAGFRHGEQFAPCIRRVDGPRQFDRAFGE